eukprot:9733629-Ditylum_brightwellii.AAC.1
MGCSGCQADNESIVNIIKQVLEHTDSTCVLLDNANIRKKSARESGRQSNAKNPPTNKPKKDLDCQRKMPCLAVIPNQTAKSIQIKHEPEVIPYSPDDQANMAPILHTHDNDDTKEDIDTDNKSTATTATDNEYNHEPDDESTTSHQPQMQSYRMNASLPIPYIATIEQFDTFQV